PTTPAQMFHLLRSQVLCPVRKPLVVMTPKSLLRLPAAASTLDELATGRYRRVLDDEAADPATVTRVVLCTGKIYYELADERARRADATIAIVRLEALLGGRPITYELISRAESASPATGSHRAHVIEQHEILARAFART